MTFLKYKWLMIEPYVVDENCVDELCNISLSVTEHLRERIWLEKLGCIYPELQMIGTNSTPKMKQTCWFGPMIIISDITEIDAPTARKFVGKEIEKLSH